MFLKKAKRNFKSLRRWATKIYFTWACTKIYFTWACTKIYFTWACTKNLFYMGLYQESILHGLVVVFVGDIFAGDIFVVGDILRLGIEFDHLRSDEECKLLSTLRILLQQHVKRLLQITHRHLWNHPVHQVFRVGGHFYSCMVVWESYMYVLVINFIYQIFYRTTGKTTACKRKVRV